MPQLSVAARSGKEAKGGLVGLCLCVGAWAVEKGGPGGGEAPVRESPYGDMQGREGWSWLTNEVVNFINTLVGALVAVAAVSLTRMAL